MDDHLIDVPSGSAPQEEGRAEDRRQPHAAIVAECQKSHDGEAQAREADFCLKRTLRPADERSGQVAEEHMRDEVVGVGNTNREKDELSEHTLEYAPRTRPPAFGEDRDAGGDKPEDQERQGKVGEDKLNECAHLAVPRVGSFCLRRRMCSGPSPQQPPTAWAPMPRYPLAFVT